MWITAILAFFKAIPAITGGITAFSNAYFNAKVQLTAARIGGDVTVVSAMLTAAGMEQQARVAGLSVIASSKTLLFLVVAFAGPWIVYEWKVVAWDNVFAFMIYGVYGSTPPIKGDVAGWATVIITSLFGSGTAVTIGHMYFNRDKTGE